MYQLFTVYQPIVNKDNETFGYESLARGRDYLKIINMFAECNVQNKGKIDFFDSMFKYLAIQNSPSIYNQKIFINCHPFSTKIVPWHWRDVHSFVEPSNVVIELTEYAHFHPSSIDEILFHKANGVEFAIDDFGSGYFDLALIKEIKPNYIKIAKEIVHSAITSSTNYLILQHLIEICNALEAKVIVEGIESEEQYEPIKDMADFFQGYLFGKPSLPSLYRKRMIAK